MRILGIGPLFSGGYGVDALTAALENGFSPERLTAAGGDGSCLLHRVNLETITDRTLLKPLRRADKLSKMAVLGAAAALADSGIDVSGKRGGIILATAFGAHVTTFDFLDGIIDYGEANVSPTAFSNSVHNAAASYVATALGITGPTLTVTAFRFSFESALQLAAAWLAQGRADYLLVGAVEQYGTVLDHVCRSKLPQAADGRMTPFALRASGNVPGEGAAFFFLDAAAADGYCRVGEIVTGEPAGKRVAADLVVLNADGMYADERGYLTAIADEQLVSAYAPVYGSIMSGSALSLAAAALMLKRQQLYAAPVLDNPLGLNIVATSGQAPLESITSLNLNCAGESASVNLQRT